MCPKVKAIVGKTKRTKKKIAPRPPESMVSPPHLPLTSTPRRVLFVWIFPGAIFLAAIYLATVNLNWVSMWDDEAASAVFSKHLALNGTLSAWDGRNLSSFYREGWFLDDDLIPRHPKMHYYLNAAAYKLFGVSAWSSRFVQVLIGFAALGIFALILRLDFYDRTDIRIIALALLALSPVYLLAIRQSHYYSVSLFFNLLLFYFYRLHLTHKSAICLVAMTAAAIAAFYSHFLIGTAFALSLGLWHLIFFRKQYSRRDWIFGACAAGIFIAFVIAYFVVTGYWSGDLIVTYRDPRFLRMAKILLLNIRAINENDFAPWPIWVWFFACIFLPALRRIAKKRPSKQHLTASSADDSTRMIFRYGVFVLLFITIIAIGSTQPSRYTSWADVRYLTSALPFSAVLCAGFVIAAHRLHLFVGVTVLITMLFSNVLGYPFLRHIEFGGRPQFTLPALVAEVHSEYRTAYAEAASFLRTHAAPDQSVIAFPMFHNWPLVFYLGDQLRFCCHISKASPIYHKIKKLNQLSLMDENFPDWLVFFSSAQIKAYLGYFSRPTQGGACRREYVLAKDLQVYFGSTQRPEPVWHRYTPVEEFSPNNSVYVFRLKAETDPCR